MSLPHGTATVGVLSPLLLFDSGQVSWPLSLSLLCQTGMIMTQHWPPRAALKRKGTVPITAILAHGLADREQPADISYCY